MKNTLFLIALVSIICMGCDGKDRVHLSNTAILKSHQLLDSFSEEIKYNPKTYSETVTDTILSNGFKVKTKAFIDMDHSVLKVTQHDAIQQKTYYRHRIITLAIEKNDTPIFDETITNAFIVKNSKSTANALEDYILEKGYSDFETSYSTNTIRFKLYFKNYITERSKSYTLEVDALGQYKVLEHKTETIDFI